MPHRSRPGDVALETRHHLVCRRPRPSLPGCWQPMAGRLVPRRHRCASQPCRPSRDHRMAGQDASSQPCLLPFPHSLPPWFPIKPHAFNLILTCAAQRTQTTYDSVCQEILTQFPLLFAAQFMTVSLSLFRAAAATSMLSEL